MKGKITAIILLLISLVETGFVSVGLYLGFLTTPGIVPIFNMDTSIAYLILWIVVPLVGSIIVVAIAPRIITPIFMLAKKVLRRGYEDGYVPTESSAFGGKMVMRLVYVYLLVVGILTTLASVFDPQAFLTNEVFTSGIAPQYNISYIFCITGIATPITMTLWSVGWALEDAGLIHYKLPPKDSGDLYEIEPVYRSFSSYVKGFAGVSTLLSLLVIYSYFIDIGLGFDAISVFLVPFHAVMVVVPSYFLYAAIGSNWLRKDKSVLRQLDKSDIELLA